MRRKRVCLWWKIFVKRVCFKPRIIEYSIIQEVFEYCLWYLNAIFAFLVSAFVCDFLLRYLKLLQNICVLFKYMCLNISTTEYLNHILQTNSAPGPQPFLSTCIQLQQLVCRCTDSDFVLLVNWCCSISMSFYYCRLEEFIMEILYGAKNHVHVFGYNCAQSEPIRMKSGAL